MSDRSLFLTGGSGFVGRRLLRALAARDDLSVYALSRSPGAESPAGRVRWLPGDLSEVGRFRDELARCEQVVHLAALTGNARRRDYFRVNVEGTERLLAACRDAGVPRFLHVSTIAVRYPEKRAYPYAQSKERAEEAVFASGLDALVVRPTIVLGRGAPAWRSLLGLARLPVVPVPGGGRTRVQPIDVDDLAACLVDAIEEREPSRRCYELGGPETLSFREFLGRIHRAARGREARCVSLPVRPLIAVLAGLERLPLPVLPVTAGQFYAFVYPSDAEPNPLVERRAPAMMDVDAMCARYLSDD